MARASGIALILLVVISASFLSNTEARKLLVSSGGGDGGAISLQALFQSLLLSAPPKGTSPSEKGQSTTTFDNVEKFQRHLAHMDRILGSVPSPGVGH